MQPQQGERCRLPCAPFGGDVFCRFFNPRTDVWSEHFALDAADGVTITALTDIALVTARVFGFNSTERLLERRALLAVGRYPTPPAKKRTEKP